MGEGGAPSPRDSRLRTVDGRRAGVQNAVGTFAESIHGNGDGDGDGDGRRMKIHHPLLATLTIYLILSLSLNLKTFNLRHRAYIDVGSGKSATTIP